ncbi:hypothetical protein NEPAR06_0867 [Nematocida parisii]|nr:hypothetical protein NEPAR06_0867 [Nematocida parisii]KAI5157552.1 hypothetical protein NEPAR05_1379 [Nematocida parisii]
MGINNWCVEKYCIRIKQKRFDMKNIHLIVYVLLVQFVSSELLEPIYYKNNSDTNNFLNATTAQGIHRKIEERGESTNSIYRNGVLRLSNLFNAFSVKIRLNDLSANTNTNMSVFRNWQKITIVGEDSALSQINKPELKNSNYYLQNIETAKKLENLLTLLSSNNNLFEIELKNLQLAYLPTSIEKIKSLRILKFENINYQWISTRTTDLILSKKETRSSNLIFCLKYIQSLKHIVFTDCTIKNYQEDEEMHDGIKNSLARINFVRIDLNFINEFMWYYCENQTDKKLTIEIASPLQLNSNIFLDIEEVNSSINELILTEFDIQYTNNVVFSNLGKLQKFTLISPPYNERVYYSDEKNNCIDFWKNLFNKLPEITIPLNIALLLEDFPIKSMPRLTIIDNSRKFKIALEIIKKSHLSLRLSTNVSEDFFIDVITANHSIYKLVSECTQISFMIEEYVGPIEDILMFILNSAHENTIININFIIFSYVYVQNFSNALEIINTNKITVKLSNLNIQMFLSLLTKEEISQITFTGGALTINPVNTP